MNRVTAGILLVAVWLYLASLIVYGFDGTVDRYVEAFRLVFRLG